MIHRCSQKKIAAFALLILMLHANVPSSSPLNLEAEIEQKVKSNLGEIDVWSLASQCRRLSSSGDPLQAVSVALQAILANKQEESASCYSSSGDGCCEAAGCLSSALALIEDSSSILNSAWYSTLLNVSTGSCLSNSLNGQHWELFAEILSLASRLESQKKGGSESHSFDSLKTSLRILANPSDLPFDHFWHAYETEAAAGNPIRAGSCVIRGLLAHPEAVNKRMLSGLQMPVGWQAQEYLRARLSRREGLPLLWHFFDSMMSDSVDSLAYSFMLCNSALLTCKWDDLAAAELVFNQVLEAVFSKDPNLTSIQQYFPMHEFPIPELLVPRLARRASQVLTEGVQPIQLPDTDLYSLFSSSYGNQGKIVVAYVYSPGFTAIMPTTRLLQLIPGLHTQALSLCISMGPPDESIEAKQWKSDCTWFRGVDFGDNLRAAEEISARQSLIAVDLAGLAPMSSPAVFAHRPAPSMVTLHGFVASMGGLFSDYFTSDRIISPPESAPLVSEKLFILPSTMFTSHMAASYESLVAAANISLTWSTVHSRYHGFKQGEAAVSTSAAYEALINAANIALNCSVSKSEFGQGQPTRECRTGPLTAALADAASATINDWTKFLSDQRAQNSVPRRQILDRELLFEPESPWHSAVQEAGDDNFTLPYVDSVMCSFNAHWKYRRDVFTVWANTIQQHANWYLRLAHPTDRASRYVLQHEMEQIERGLSKRLSSGPWLPWGHHLLVKSHLCDIALDTPWFNGHTTTVEMQWAGLPVVSSIASLQPWSRVAASLLLTACKPHSDPRLASIFFKAVRDSKDSTHGMVWPCATLARDIGDYRSILGKIAGNPSLKQRLTSGAHVMRLASRVFDFSGWVSDWERGLRTIADVSAAGKPNMHIIVAEAT